MHCSWQHVIVSIVEQRVRIGSLRIWLKLPYKTVNRAKPMLLFGQGLLPLTFSIKTGYPLSYQAPESIMLTMGAMADSAYEYFLKSWLLTGKKVIIRIFLIGCKPIS